MSQPLGPVLSSSWQKPALYTPLGLGIALLIALPLLAKYGYLQKAFSFIKVQFDQHFVPFFKNEVVDKIHSLLFSEVSAKAFFISTGVGLSFPLVGGALSLIFLKATARVRVKFARMQAILKKIQNSSAVQEAAPAAASKENTRRRVFKTLETYKA